VRGWVRSKKTLETGGKSIRQAAICDCRNSICHAMHVTNPIRERHSESAFYLGNQLQTSRRFGFHSTICIRRDVDHLIPNPDAGDRQRRPVLWQLGMDGVAVCGGLEP